jgi:predicted RNA-binding protein YlxR (DUF448 family)
MAVAPARTCIGCRQVCPASELVRLTVQPGLGKDKDNGKVVTAVSSAGRGAWLHPREECLRAAVRGRAFARAFKRSVAVPPPEELMAALRARA